MTTTEVLWEYDTVVWRQRLDRSVAGTRLTRAYRGGGPWPGTVPEAVGAVSGSGVVLVPPSGSTAATYTFDLVEEEQLAVQLWPRAAPVFLSEDGVGGLRRLGALLARLHRAPVRSGLAPVSSSPHVRRLRDYLHGPVPAATEEALRSLAPVTVAGLGAVLEALEAAPRPVVCHGGFSLGSVFADPDHRRLELVVGPELCLAPPELDLGWMLGELTEYELSTVRAGSRTDLFSRAAAALRSGYDEEAGAALDATLLDGVVAARVALHRFDYVTTSGHPEQTTISAFIDWLVERWRRGHDTRKEDAR